MLKIPNPLNIRRYFTLGIVITLLSTLPVIFDIGSETVDPLTKWQHLGGIGVVYIATVLNHFMLLAGITEILRPVVSREENPAPVDKLRVAGLFVGKLVFLFAGLALGIHLMGKRVIIPLLNYVLQIFVLTYSSKRS